MAPEEPRAGAGECAVASTSAKRSRGLRVKIPRDDQHMGDFNGIPIDLITKL